MQPNSLVTCHRLLLEDRCTQRGYTLEEVMPCVTLKHGDQWTVDVGHAAYPHKPKPGFVPPPPRAATPPPPPQFLRGPGTELKALLAKVGITTSPDCKCNRRAIYMNEQGCDWCEANIDEIVGWLRESAAERGLPFLDVAARLLVRRAIANARRKSTLTS